MVIWFNKMEYLLAFVGMIFNELKDTGARLHDQEIKSLGGHRQIFWCVT